MKILIVSGFLGAGKTTFIKHLISKTNKQFVILENEYGNDNLDSKTLSEAGDLEILEFMEGCVCCSKKDSFINTLLAINASLEPEYLIVEPSGIGKLSNIIDNVKQIVYEKINLLDPILILSPSNIDLYLKEYPDIYLDQIRNAKKIIFSKIENEDEILISEAIKKIKEYNQNCQIIDSPYQNKENDFFDKLLLDENEIVSIKKETNRINLIKQYTLNETNLINISELIIILEDILRNRFGKIIRAKGILNINKERIRFDLADNKYLISSIIDDDINDNLVFIGEDINENLINHVFKTKKKKIDLINRYRQDR